jgi:hypothetical protein
MQPLPTEPLYELKQPTFEKVCMWIPLLGWCVGAILQKKRFRPVVHFYDEILAGRNQQLVIGIWTNQDRDVYEEIAQTVGEEIGWKYPRFLPDDPLAVIFWAHQDGFDGTMATMRLEQRFGISLSEEECGVLSCGRLSDLVQTIRKKRANQTPHPTTL